MAIKGIPNTFILSPDGKPYKIRSAVHDDVNNIFKCYREIHITAKESLAAFAERGGMFRIPAKKTIANGCSETKRSFAVACDSCGNIIALMRLSRRLSDYKQWNPKKDLSYVELVVTVKGLSVPFLTTVFQNLCDDGCKGLYFQIYQLLSFNTDGGIDLLNYDNQPSIKLHSKIGARQIGALPEKKLVFADGHLHIRPNVYYLDLCDAVTELTVLGDKSGWRLSE